MNLDKKKQLILELGFLERVFGPYLVEKKNSQISQIWIRIRIRISIR